MAKYLLHFSYCIQMNTFVYASNTNKLGKIGCKTRGAWKSQMTFITFCYCLLFVVRYKELRLAVARIRMVLEKESKQKSPLVNLVLLFPHGTKWTLRPTLCFWLLVLWNLVILVSMTNLTNIMIKRNLRYETKHWVMKNKLTKRISHLFFMRRRNNPECIEFLLLVEYI